MIEKKIVNLAADINVKIELLNGHFIDGLEFGKWWSVTGIASLITLIAYRIIVTISNVLTFSTVLPTFPF